MDGFGGPPDGPDEEGEEQGGEAGQPDGQSGGQRCSHCCARESSRWERNPLTKQPLCTRCRQWMRRHSGALPPLDSEDRRPGAAPVCSNCGDDCSGPKQYRQGGGSRNVAGCGEQGGAGMQSAAVSPCLHARPLQSWNGCRAAWACLRSASWSAAKVHRCRASPCLPRCPLLHAGTPAPGGGCAVAAE